MIEGLHHNAYRCRDSEETRRFYEEFLGLPLVNAFEIKETKSGLFAAALGGGEGLDPLYPGRARCGQCGLQGTGIWGGSH